MKVNIKSLVIWMNVVLGVVVSVKNCVRRSGSFCTACSNGYYIYNHTCYQCKSACVTCTSFSDCSSCKNGFYGKSCNQCDLNCNDSICNKTDGKCSFGCSDGYFQSGSQCVRCSNSVSNCEICINANQCTKCAGGSYSIVKSDRRLSCKSCPPNKWGYECEHNCSTDCVNTTCNPSNGHCHHCHNDQYGKTCQFRCSDGCYQGNGTGVCDRETGECLHGCKRGYAGLKCNSMFDRETGECLHGCRSGYGGLKCNLKGTPVDGQWGHWSEFVSCSVTCGSGTTSRTRSCNSPSSQYGGQNCSGNAIDTLTCNLSNCPVDIFRQTDDDISNSGTLIRWITLITVMVIIGVVLAVTFIFHRVRQNDTRNTNAHRSADTPGIEVDPVQYEQLTERTNQNTTYMELKITEYESIDENHRRYSGSLIENTVYQHVT